MALRACSVCGMPIPVEHLGDCEVMFNLPCQLWHLCFNCQLETTEWLDSRADPRKAADAGPSATESSPASMSSSVQSDEP